MKIVTAIDSFKGSMTSMEAGLAVTEGIHRVDSDVDVQIRPLADGGEGTVGDAVALALRCVAYGLAVQVAVVALGHAELIQHIHQLLCLCAGVDGRVVEKSDFFCRIPRRL